MAGKRFWSKVRRGAEYDCWEWEAARNSDGYGNYTEYVGGKQTYKKAHRVSYEEAKGAIPKGMNILHSCDNPPCVNPRHLRAGTQVENILDMKRKGRAPSYKAEKNPRTKLTWDDVRSIREGYKEGIVTRKTLGELYGITESSIGRILGHHTWKEEAI